MMPMIRTTALLALALSAVNLDNRALAQEVILSEFGVGPTGGFVELHNRGATTADISAWSLFLATPTVGMPRTYWWGFRPASTIPAGGFLVVRWLQPLPSAPVSGEVFTGATNAYFLFGLGGEALPLQQGALALFRSQSSALMSTPSIINDWVSWGGNGLSREDLAVQNGAWRTGSRTPSLSNGCSLARHPGREWSTTPDLAWFVDTTPTPGAANVGAASLQSLGSPCTPIGHQLLGAPTLNALSLPVLGNSSFGFTIDNTTGVFAEWCILALTATTMPGRNDLLPPAPGGESCYVLIDPSTSFGSYWQHTSLLRTTLPLSQQGLPAALAGQSYAEQAIVLDLYSSAWPPYKGVTNAVTVTLGN